MTKNQARPVLFLDKTAACELLCVVNTDLHIYSVCREARPPYCFPIVTYTDCAAILFQPRHAY